MKRGRSRVAGESGGYWKLTRAVCEIGGELIRERRWTLLLAPLLLLVPIVTLVNLTREIAFARKWGGRIDRAWTPLAGVPAACLRG